MAQYVYPGDLQPGTVARSADINSRVLGLATSVNNVDGTQLQSGVVTLQHLVSSLASQVVQSGALPTSPAAYQPWIDSGVTGGLLKHYMGSAWRSYAALDAANAFSAANSFAGQVSPGTVPLISVGDSAGSLVVPFANVNRLINSSGRHGMTGWVDHSGGVLKNRSRGNWSQVGAAADLFGVSTSSGSVAANVAAYLESSPMNIGAGVELTFSGVVYVDGSSFSGGTAFVAMVAYDSGGTFIANFVSQTFNPGTGWQRFSITGTTPANTATVTVQIGIEGTSTTAATWTASDVVEFGMLKLENGAVATPHTLEGDTIFGPAASVTSTSVASAATILSYVAQDTGIYRFTAYGGAWTCQVPSGTAVFTGVASGVSRTVYVPQGDTVAIVNDAGATATYSAVIERVA